MRAMIDEQTRPKISPFEPITRRLGAQFTFQAGWQVAQRFTSTAAELAVARAGVVLADRSALGKILIQGPAAAAALSARWAEPLPTIGNGRHYPEAELYCLRPDRFFARTAPEKTTAVYQMLNDAASQTDDLAAVIEVTHGRAEIALIGPQSATLLSRLCGLDFHPDHFPNLSARQSSVAKTNQLIIRRDLGYLPAYSLIGDRSLAVYLWEAISEAGLDLDLQPAGWEAVEMLQNEG